MAFSIAERYIGIPLSLLGFVVVARLLTPTDIGLFSIATAIVGLAHVVRDFGIGSYLVQEPELTPKRINTAFTLTAAVGAALFCATIVAAPWVADFYADAHLAVMLRLLSINFLLIPVGSTSLALLRREMRFGSIFIVNVSAAVVGFAVTISLAFLGYGYMSLVWSSVATMALTAGVAWYLRPSESPVRIGLAGWRRVLGFGSQLTVAGIVSEVAMNINDLVVGRLLGAAPVALISRAQGVMNLMHRDLLGAVTGVTFSSFSQTRREGGDLVGSFEHGLALVSVVAWPFYGFLALYPTDSLRLLFGPQWDAAAALVPIFCLAGAFAVFWKLVPGLIQAVGRADLTVRTELIIQSLRIALIVAVVAMFRSLEAFAWTFALVYALSIPVFNRYLRIAVGRPVSMLPSAAIKSACVTAGSLSIAAALSQAQASGLLPEHSHAILFLAALSTIGLWIVCVRLFRHPLAGDPAFERFFTVFLPRKAFP